MPRRARIALPNVPLHMLQRGNKRQACFFDDEEWRRYLDWLTEYAGRNGCRVHAYVLMTNHVHLLLSRGRADSGGTLWEGRIGSCPVQEESYLLACQRYIELIPVRANMVAHPAEHRWSSYRANAQGEADARVQAHPLYVAMGDDAMSRCAA